MKKGYKHPICGEKLKEVRKNNGKTQKGFVEELDCCAEPKTLREWEKYGIPGSYELNNICDVLHCDADYLLGRMDAKTHDQKFITQETGLTEEAVKNIQNWWIKRPVFQDEFYDGPVSDMDALNDYLRERKAAFPEENIEKTKQEICKKKQKHSKPLQILNLLLTTKAGQHFFDNLEAYLDFEYEPTEEEVKKTEEYNKRLGKNYKSVIKGKNGYVDSAYLNRAFLVAIQENLVKLKEEYESTSIKTNPLE